VKPVVVTVGPLASAAANNICTSQACGGAFALALNGTLASGSSATNVAQAQAVGSATDLNLNGSTVVGGVANLAQGANAVITSAGNDAGISFTVYGYVWVPGSQTPLFKSETVTGANTSSVATRTVWQQITRVAASAAAAGNVSVGTGGYVATLDKPRRILLTSGGDDSDISFTLYGTDWNGNPISETITGSNGSTVTTTRDFKTITAIWPSAAVQTTVTVGTTTIATSRPIRLDNFTNAPTALQVVCSGTAVWTVQQTLDDVDAVGYANATWFDHPDANMVNQSSTNRQSQYAYLPLFVRLYLASGSGSATLTVIQASSPQ
jgi:hypothetical protein